LLYGIPPGVRLRTTAEHPAPGEELRFQGKGAQTVLPPSRHPLGGYYAWVPGHAPWEFPAAPMPAWLVEQMRPADPQADAPQAGAPSSNGERVHVRLGHRHEYLLSVAGWLRRKGVGNPALEAALQAVNQDHCEPPLERTEVTYPPTTFTSVTGLTRAPMCTSRAAAGTARLPAGTVIAANCPAHSP
jgi:hypothetical protein